MANKYVLGTVIGGHSILVPFLGLILLSRREASFFYSFLEPPHWKFETLHSSSH